MSERLKAVLLSGLVCPGAGQVYLRRYAVGALLVIVTLFLLACVAYVTWMSALDVFLTTPPDEILGDLLGAAHRIMEKDRGFFDRAGMGLLVAWAYGILDAFIAGGKTWKKNTK